MSDKSHSTKRTKKRRRRTSAPTVICIQTVIDMFGPVFEDVSTVAKAHENALLGIAGHRLRNVALDIGDRGRKFLNELADRLPPDLRK